MKKLRLVIIGILLFVVGLIGLIMLCPIDDETYSAQCVLDDYIKNSMEEELTKYHYDIISVDNTVRIIFKDKDDVTLSMLKDEYTWLDLVYMIESKSGYFIDIIENEGYNYTNVSVIVENSKGKTLTISTNGCIMYDCKEDILFK